MIESRAGRQVLVTGVGVVAPSGIGKHRFWDALSTPVEPAKVRRVAEFDPGWFGLSRVEARRLDPFAQFAVGAAVRPQLSSSRPSRGWVGCSTPTATWMPPSPTTIGRSR